MENFLTVKEFAESVGVTQLTVNRWLHAGKIDGKKFGRFWRIHRSELEKVLPQGRK